MHHRPPQIRECELFFPMGAAGMSPEQLLTSLYQSVGSAQPMIQNKQVEALITGTSPPIVALIPSAGGGGRWKGVAARSFPTF